MTSLLSLFLLHYFSQYLPLYPPIFYALSICQFSFLKVFFFLMMFTALQLLSFLSRSFLTLDIIPFFPSLLLSFLRFSSLLFSSLLFSFILLFSLFSSFLSFSSPFFFFLRFSNHPSLEFFVYSHLLREGMPLAIFVASQSFSGTRPIQRIVLGYRLHRHR